MKPIVLIHGYSAESEQTTKSAIESIYGDLPRVLKGQYGRDRVVEINLSRYISLDDGISLDDISRGLNRVLNDEYRHLLKSGFHCVVHSTGALVIRNWLRRFSAKPSPLQNLVYLAGANFGSGWAHIGKGQFAKWGRMVFQQGERGVRVLHALELGSSWTIDLHRHFLSRGNHPDTDYGVYEHVVIGSQADVGWFAAPIRYAKEDGSDGVVRVAASNLNYNYVRFEPTAEALRIDWKEALRQRNRDRNRQRQGRESWYEVVEASQPGIRGRPVIPFGIPYECAHSGEKMGVVTGEACREQILRMLDLAFKTDADNWAVRVDAYNRETAATYEQVLSDHVPSRWRKWLTEPRAQYDKHAQVVIRVRDQDGRPIEHFDVFFNSVLSLRDGSLPINRLMEAKHVNSLTPGVITFYLRTDAFDEVADAGKGGWTPRVPLVDGCYLEVSAAEPQTEDILYLPMRFEFTPQQLVEYIQPHRTTILDIVLLRLPSPDVYRMVTA
ncbi:MAG: hypothetical protein GC159_17750 [Phycisphaera sp.]|nr:hypothetical protein [Phycisphaera sp.]